MLCEANLAKLRQYSRRTKFKYGYEIPNNYKHAIKNDQLNGNTQWKDATRAELESMETYQVFKDYAIKATPPPDYKIIWVHLIYNVKNDGQHKARLVADGHLTDIPNKSVYSSIVSLRGLQILLFLAELNGLEVWGTDIGNTYLEALMSKRACIRAGPEFRALAEHLLLIYKALYGFCLSGARWHDRLSDVLRQEGFMPCQAEPDIWMHQNGEQYEYIAVYVDDLTFALKDPQTFIDILKQKHNFKIKEAGPLKFHLGADFFWDKEGTMWMRPKSTSKDWQHHMKRCLERDQVPRCTWHWRKTAILS